MLLIIFPISLIIRNIPAKVPIVINPSNGLSIKRTPNTIHRISKIINHTELPISIEEKLNVICILNRWLKIINNPNKTGKTFTKSFLKTIVNIPEIIVSIPLKKSKL